MQPYALGISAECTCSNQSNLGVRSAALRVEMDWLNNYSPQNETPCPGNGNMWETIANYAETTGDVADGVAIGAAGLRLITAPTGAGGGCCLAAQLSWRALSVGLHQALLICNYGDSLLNALILCHSRSSASCNPGGSIGAARPFLRSGLCPLSASIARGGAAGISLLAVRP